MAILMRRPRETSRKPDADDCERNVAHEQVSSSLRRDDSQDRGHDEAKNTPRRVTTTDVGSRRIR